jgi:hypothetical protein
MGIVMMRCPATGRAISTGIDTDPVRFSRTVVFMGRTFCPHCRVEHEWFARDAWVAPARESRNADELEDAD